MVMKVALKELNMGSSELSISFSCSVLNNQRCQCFVYIGVKTEGAPPHPIFWVGGLCVLCRSQRVRSHQLWPCSVYCDVCYITSNISDLISRCIGECFVDYELTGVVQ